MIPVTVLKGGDDVANALIYKPLSGVNMAYLQDQLQSTYANIRNIGERFVGAVKSMFNNEHSEEKLNRARMALYSAGVHFDQNMIHPVTYNNYSNMNLLMQRYVMSQPDVNAMYKKNKCYGFQETYVDPEPGIYGEERTDYRRVMDGMLQFEKDDEGLGYFMHYSDTSDADDLSTLDKMSVLQTWDVAARLLSEGLDPTHPDKEEL